MIWMQGFWRRHGYICKIMRKNTNIFKAIFKIDLYG